MDQVLVLGLGVSGMGVAKLLLSQGNLVIGVEENLSLKKEEELRPLIKGGMRVCSRLDEALLNRCDFAVVSPGISPRSAHYLELKKAGIECVGEADYCFRGVKQPVIGITGTNGKTTVTKLTEHVLNASGRCARALGNVGDSLGDYFSSPDPEEILVVELSSFQLHRFKQNVFDLGIILNLEEDHLEWHGSMREYSLAKLQMGRCLKKDGRFFIHDAIKKECEKFLKKVSFDTFGGQACEKIACNLSQEYRKLSKHELENRQAAWLLTSHFGVIEEQFYLSLKSFQMLVHRLEFVALIEGVNYYNDSKGTNVAAVKAAVDAMEGPVLLIAGGVDKGGSFKPWIQSFHSRVKLVLAIGEAAGKIQNEIGTEIEVEVVERMDLAVKRAEAIAKRGDNVLLSPGCASFDQFQDYRHRGNAFKQEISILVERRNKQ